jgi:Bifunctional DNA primase/polymerase, N-terminal/Primase C terminal 1 (PriCT-1)
MSTSFLTFLDRASIMIERGIPIVPLPAAKKDPPPKGFPTLATTDIGIIKGWLVPNGKPAVAFEDSNCACVAKPDGFWFFDIDDVRVVSAQIEKGTGHKLQEIQTMVVRSSGDKEHFYFKQNDASRALGNFDFDAPDGSEWFSVRGNNKYVVSPYSIHPKTGREYEITNSADIIEAPVWLTDWLKTAKRSSSMRKKKMAADETTKICEGGRDEFLFAKACELRDAKMSQKAALAALLVINTDQCVPPMSVAVVETKIISAYTRDARTKSTALHTAETFVESGTSPTDIDFVDDPDEPEQPLPDFTSMITGSIADLARAWEHDLPMEFKVMTLVTKIGLALSGKITLEGYENLQPRFYTTLIAPRWYGKTAVIETSGFDDRELYDTAFSLDSGPVLVRNFLARHSYLHPDALTLTPDPLALLLSPDEIKDVFEKSKSSKESKDSIQTKLLRLHDSNKVGNNTLRGGNVNLTTAHFAMLGGATPEGYDGMWINTGGGMNGMQSRMSAVGTNNGQVPQRRRPSDKNIVAVNRVRIMAQIRSVSQGTLMPTTEEAETVMADWWTPQSKIPQSSRVPDIVRRLAEVYAVTNDMDSITEAIMRMALPFGDHLIAMRVKYNPQDSVSNVQAMENRIEDCYKKYGDMADRQLMRRVQPARYPGGYQAFGSARRAMKDAGAIRSKGKVRHGQYKVEIFGR